MRVVLGLALVAPAAALVNNGGVTPNHQPSGGTRGLVLPRHVAATAEVAAPVTVDACGVALDGQELERRLRATSFLYPEKVEVIKDLEPFVETQIEDRLLTAETAWQPMDFVPDFSKESWEEDLKDFRRQSEGITDEMLVVLIGDMVTEEALPTYQTLLNTFEGADDPTGVSQNPWSKWSRKWTSEENRHGDLLNRYLYLTGRCDMRAIEVTIQRLITSGFNAGANKDPYRGFIYTSFQERATKISHGNVGKIAKKQGDSNLARICATIAGDEARHEKAYQAFVKELLARDPDNTLLAFADMMRGQITMPAQLMDDGLHVGGQKPAPGDSKLFASFSVVAQKLGVYTVLDYANIMEHLMKIWNISELEGLSAEAVEAQDYLCKLPKRYGRLAERAMKKETGANHVPVEFSWVNGRLV